MSAGASSSTNPNDQSAFNSFPVLTSDQQRLLLAALTSNNGRRLNMAEFRNSYNDSASNGTQIFKHAAAGSPSMTQGIDPHVFEQSQRSATSPSDKSPASAWEPSIPTFGDNFLPDFSNGAETDFNVDLPQDVLDGLSSGNGEKRKSPEDEEDDDDRDEQDSKRQEGDEKVPKKPGRKPLTVEPTTKRKAQNRAAQRAFRERKEQHLKDLEQKINDLQKVSQTANHENSLLRAQVMTLQTELQSYKKRLSINAGISTGVPQTTALSNFANLDSTSSNPFDFSFDAPTNYGYNAPSASRSNHNSVDSTYQSGSFSTYVKPEPTSRSNSETGSPAAAYGNSRGSAVNNTKQGTNSALSPDFFNMAAQSYGFPQFGSPNSLQNHSSPEVSNGNSSSVSQQRSVSTSTVSHAPSPTASSVSRNGASSSCGTSPEPTADYNAQDKSTAQPEAAKSPFGDLADFQFDPSLFGGYRETQDAIYGDGDFSGGLYDDFLNMPDTALDFSTSEKKAPTPAPTKPNLLEEVDRRRDAGPEDNSRASANQGANKKEMVTVNKIWQQLQGCPKFQDGELDIDGLCSELSTKATCSESGAKIPKDEWEQALWRMVGMPAGSKPPGANGSK